MIATGHCNHGLLYLERHGGIAMVVRSHRMSVSRSATGELVPAIRSFANPPHFPTPSRRIQVSPSHRRGCLRTSAAAAYSARYCRADWQSSLIVAAPFAWRMAWVLGLFSLVAIGRRIGLQLGLRVPKAQRLEGGLGQLRQKAGT